MFTGSLLEIAATELRLVLDALDMTLDGDVERLTFGRAQVLRFSVAGEPGKVAALCGQLSAAAALFETTAETGELLRPIEITDALVFGSELATIQRYKGKTNERLTRAMLNIALATAGIDLANPDGTVLDPMCGRGTTLNWALAYGLDAIGVEADRNSVDHYAGFLETWAKRQRLPHKMQKFRAKNNERRCATLDVAIDRATLKSGSGSNVQTFSGDAGDTTLAIKKSSVDVIVCDLPYGVQHQGSDKGTSVGSETAELLNRVLPAWDRWMRPGGAVCLAWNLKRASHRDVGRALADAGFTPVTATGGHTMIHTVDATIERDVIVARKN